MFVVARLFDFVVQPLAWVGLLLVLALLLMYRNKSRAASRCVFLACALLLLTGWTALPNALLRPLENQYATIEVDPARFVGMVVLGGSVESGLLPVERNQVLMNDAAERMTIAVALARRYPHMKIVLTGGESRIFNEGISEAEMSQRFFSEQGVDSARLILEGGSRNTFENAVNTAGLSNVNRLHPWLLVTSASHMPRALWTFKKADWNVTPYPVDYQTGTNLRWNDYSLSQGTRRWQVALHEYLGLLVYWFLGRL